jgi:hypothetical protein
MKSEYEARKWIRLFASFKSHLTVFIIANVILWVIWLAGRSFNFNSFPVYISLVWLAILVIHCIIVYKVFKIKKTE